MITTFENQSLDFTNAYIPQRIEITDRERKIKKFKKRLLYVLKILNYLIMICVGLMFVYPFVWMFLMSLRTRPEAMAFEAALVLPSGPHWENYLEAWEKAKFSQYIGNSVIYVVLVLGLQYLFIVPAAYAFARMEFKGNKALWAVKQLGMMLPGEATLIPTYYIYSQIGLVDTWTGLILPSLFNMFGIYMFMNNFKQIPSEVIEAAKMDRAKNRTIMLKIMVPMIFPVFVTHILLTFISTWNEYYWVLVMTNTEACRTLPVALRGLLKADGVMPPWEQVMAGNIMQLAPILLMYICGSQTIKSAMVGGRKVNTTKEKKGNFITRFVSDKIEKRRLIKYQELVQEQIESIDE